MAERRLKFGQIGGGRDAFIGRTHRRAAITHGRSDLVAGALSSTPERARQSGEEVGLSSERNYGNWQEMLDQEGARDAGDRLDFVCIVTPNHVHFEPALAFVDAGFNVIIDKPLVHTSRQAQTLIEAVERQNVVFGVTYNYTGYPMVKEARHWLKTGKLGEIRRVVVEYPQGWLGTKLEDEGHKQAAWRTDPQRSGIAGAVGDIGSHAENLASYVTGLELQALCADVSTFVEGRLLDDDASVLLRYRGGAKGILWVSQVASGEENSLNIRVYGTEGNLFWALNRPNVLIFNPTSGPAQILQRGNAYLCEAAIRAGHIAPGLHEGYFDAFGNIYMSFTDTIRARQAGQTPTALELDFPDVYAGARGVRFIEKVIESGRSARKWIDFD